MKVLNFLLLQMAISLMLSAQNTDEWLRQAKTQRKYLIEQILALRTFSDCMQTGYSIVDQGLTAIENIKKGDLILHETFFHSESITSPAVAQLSTSLGIFSLCKLIVRKSNVLDNNMRDHQCLLPGEIVYVHRSCQRVIEDLSNLSNDLVTLSTPGEYQLSDHARIRRLESLYGSLQSAYQFLIGVQNSVKVLCNQRLQEDFNRQLVEKMSAKTR
jgi:hypothetical protein